MQANETHWIEEAELCVTRAADLLALAEATLCESELEAASLNLRQAFNGPSNVALDAQARERLQVMRKQLVMLQITAKHREALYTGLEQLDPESVVGYTPAGLERAL